MIAFLKKLFVKKQQVADETGERKRKLAWYAKKVSKKYNKTFRTLAHE